MLFSLTLESRANSSASIVCLFSTIRRNLKQITIKESLGVGKTRCISQFPCDSHGSCCTYVTSVWVCNESNDRPTNHAVMSRSRVVQQPAADLEFYRVTKMLPVSFHLLVLPSPHFRLLYKRRWCGSLSSVASVAVVKCQVLV